MHPDEDRRRRFVALADETLEPVRRYLARRTDVSTAEDVLSEVMLVCWRKCGAVAGHVGASTGRDGR